MQKDFIADGDVVSQCLEFIHAELETLKMGKRERIRTELMCEESLVGLMAHADFTESERVRVNVSKFLGNVSVYIAVPGREFDFSGVLAGSLNLDEDILPDSAEAIRNMLLRSFSQNLKYRHSGRYNTIKIRAVRSAYSGVYVVLCALISAIAAGLLMRAFAPESVHMFVNDNIFVPVRTVFMNGLMLCAIPLVFLSIVSCMSDTGNISGIRHTGGKILGCFLMTQVVALMIAFGLMLVFRVGEGAGLTVPSSVNAQAASVSLLDTLVNVIPSDVVSPFLKGDMLQLIVLAVLLGVSARLSGAKTLTHILTELNDTFTRAMSIFMKIIPLVVFCSIASLILTTGASTLLSVVGITLTLAAGDVLLFVLYWLMVKILAHLNPVAMYKKSLPALITAASTCSSIAALPDAMRCAQNMGVPPHVYSFTLPLGITINKNISLIYLVAGVMFTANIYGRVLTLGDMAFLGISALVLVTGALNISGGAAAVMPVILAQMGIPADTVPLFFMIGAVIDMLDTSTVCVGPIATSLLVSAREGILDIKEYNKP